MKNIKNINSYNYFLFFVDIINKPTEIMSWNLEEGKISQISRMDTKDRGGCHAILKLAPQPEHSLSDLYIYDHNNNRSLVSLCKTTPDFVNLLTSLSFDERREKIAPYYWDYPSKNGGSAYNVPTEIFSIFKLGGGKIPMVNPPYLIRKLLSIFKIRIGNEHYKTFYLDRPLLLYIEPKSDITLSEMEMYDVLTYLRKELNLFHQLTDVFSDSAVTSFINTGSNLLSTTLVYLAKNKLNYNEKELKVQRFFWNIIDYTIAYHTLKSNLKLISEYEKKVDSYMNDGQVLKQQLKDSERINHEKFHFLILELRNGFNLLSNQIYNELPKLREIDNRITYSVQQHNTNFIENDTFSVDLALNLKELISTTEENLKYVSDKINFQMEFSFSYFQSITTIENIHLQKKVHSLSMIVLFLTLVTFFFSQWNEDTILNKIIKFIYSIYII